MTRTRFLLRRHKRLRLQQVPLKRSENQASPDLAPQMLLVASAEASRVQLPR